MEYVKWINLIMGIFGVWLIASPYILGFAESRAPFFNNLIVGILVVVVAAIHGYLEFKIPTMRPSTAER